MRRVFVGLAQVFVGLAAQLLCVVRIQGVGTGLSRSQRAFAERVSNQAEQKKGPNAMSFWGEGQECSG